MSRIANTSGRAYRSQLRAEHAKETRTRVLDATVRVIASGIANLSIPAVAREAGVSIPTIYRHFGTKADLVAAVYPHIVGQAAYEATRTAPESVSAFRDLVGMSFARLEALDDAGRAAMATPAAEEVRRASMPERVAMTRQFVATVAPTAGDADRERITRLLSVITNSAAMHVWRDYFGSTADRAAADVEWVLRAVIAAAAQAD